MAWSATNYKHPREAVPGKRALWLIATFLGITLSVLGPARTTGSWRSSDADTKGPRGQALHAGGDVYDVKAYGAKGDGKKDDTKAIQAAVNTSDRAGGGVIYLPPGSYKITSAIASTNVGTSFQGAGKSVSTIINSGKGDTIFVKPPFTPLVRGGFFSHFKIQCAPQGSPPAPGTSGIHSYAATARLYEDLYIVGCGTGIELQNQSPAAWSEQTEMSQVMLSNNHYGVELVGSGSASSFAYSELDIYCELNSNPPPTSGACLSDSGGWLYNGSVRIRNNMPGIGTSLGPDVIQIDNFGKINPTETVEVVGEGATGQPVVATGDATLIYGVVLRSSVLGSIPYLAKSYPAWQPRHAYSVGNAVASGCSAGDVMMAVNAGTSGSSAPAWHCGTGSSARTLDLRTADNNVTWRDVGQYPGRNGGQHDPIVQVLLAAPDAINRGRPYGNEHFVGIASGQGAPSGGCYSGNLYVNLAGRSGNTLFACVSGLWVNVK
jgi:hypothetical protein